MHPRALARGDDLVGRLAQTVTVGCSHARS
jgi:hypothetical protein